MIKNMRDMRFPVSLETAEQIKQSGMLEQRLDEAECLVFDLFPHKLETWTKKKVSALDKNGARALIQVLSDYTSLSVGASASLVRYGGSILLKGKDVTKSNLFLVLCEIVGVENFGLTPIHSSTGGVEHSFQ